MLLKCEWTLRRFIEERQVDVAWALPRWLVYWAVIRCFAHGTSGKYGSTHPDELTYDELLRRWDDTNKA